MDETLTEKQRVIIVEALKNYYAWLGVNDKDKDEVIWLIDLIDLKQCITVSRTNPSAD